MKKKQQNFSILFLIFAVCISSHLSAQEIFPDGTPIPDWFRQDETVDINSLGEHFCITDYGVVNDSTVVQTGKIQSVIDKAFAAGGGVVIIPQGTFLSGALFFKPKTHLFLKEGAVLKGSDDISHFPVVMTRIEGQNRKYFPALINADQVNGFTISGKGILNGNGLRYWKSFWLRRSVNPGCTNLDELRPRLLHVTNSKDVQISGVKFINSPFWTTHFYKCENVKLLNLYIYSPASPVKAPSTDAIDLDVCTNVLIKNCYMSVNDDAIALKGGKGPFADKEDTNGSNCNILIEDCEYGYCHSALTCGSESIHNRNIILRRGKMDNAQCVLRLKMRPDTPQHYEYLLVEQITGKAGVLININPWTQFFDLQGEEGIKLSYADNITLRDIDLECSTVFHVRESEQYKLANFTFENLKLKVQKNPVIHKEYVKNFVIKNVAIK